MTSSRWAPTNLMLLGTAAVFALSPLARQFSMLPPALILLLAAATWLRPTAGLAAVVVSVPVQNAVMLSFVTGELTYTQICIAGLTLGWLLSIRRYRIWLDAVVVGFALVMAAWLHSFLATDSLTLFLEENYRWAVAGLIYLVARSVLRRWNDVRWMLWAMVIGLLGASSQGIVQFVERSGPASHFVAGELRVSAAFGTPNTLAAYIEFTAPLLIAVCLAMLIQPAWLRADRLLFAGVLVSSGLGVLVMILTQSRGGWVGLAGGLSVIVLGLRRKHQLITIVAAALLLIGVLLTPVGQSQLERFERAFAPTQQSALPVSSFDSGIGRSAIWRAAINMIRQNPDTGVGAGEFDYHFRQYVTMWLDRLPRGQAHNGWLQTGATAGVPGMLAFTAWLGASVWACVTAWIRSRNLRSRFLALGGLAVMIAFSLHNLVDYLNVLSLGLQLSVVTAIAQTLVPAPLTRYARANTKPGDAIFEPVSA